MGKRISPIQVEMKAVTAFSKYFLNHSEGAFVPQFETGDKKVGTDGKLNVYNVLAGQQPSKSNFESSIEVQIKGTTSKYTKKHSKYSIKIEDLEYFIRNGETILFLVAYIKDNTEILYYKFLDMYELNSIREKAGNKKQVAIEFYRLPDSPEDFLVIYNNRKEDFNLTSIQVQRVKDIKNFKGRYHRNLVLTDKDQLSALYGQKFLLYNDEEVPAMTIEFNDRFFKSDKNSVFIFGDQIIIKESDNLVERYRKGIAITKFIRLKFLPEDRVNLTFDPDESKGTIEEIEASYRIVSYLIREGYFLWNDEKIEFDFPQDNYQSLLALAKNKRYMIDTLKKLKIRTDYIWENLTNAEKNALVKFLEEVKKKRDDEFKNELIRLSIEEDQYYFLWESDRIVNIMDENEYETNIQIEDLGGISVPAELLIADNLESIVNFPFVKLKNYTNKLDFSNDKLVNIINTFCEALLLAYDISSNDAYLDVAIRYFSKILESSVKNRKGYVIYFVNYAQTWVRLYGNFSLELANELTRLKDSNMISDFEKTLILILLSTQYSDVEYKSKFECLSSEEKSIIKQSPIGKIMDSTSDYNC